MTRITFRSAEALGLLLIVVLPALALPRKDQAPAPPNVVSIDVLTPSIAPAPETKPLQTKGGITISIDTDTYQTAAVPEAVESQFQPGFKEMFHIPCTGAFTPGVGHIDYFLHNFEPTAVTKPDHLVLHLHITSSLPRVFRGSGAIVQFQVAGKALHVNPSGYGDFLNAIIPPRSSQDIDIVGPAIADLPQRATVGVYIYDVVTRLDEAGNIQEKQNFEWYYAWETQRHAAEVTLPAQQKFCKRY
jgi:hypothetical protein